MSHRRRLWIGVIFVLGGFVSAAASHYYVARDARESLQTTLQVHDPGSFAWLTSAQVVARPLSDLSYQPTDPFTTHGLLGSLCKRATLWAPAQRPLAPLESVLGYGHIRTVLVLPYLVVHDIDGASWFETAQSGSGRSYGYDYHGRAMDIGFGPLLIRVGEWSASATWHGGPARVGR